MINSVVLGNVSFCMDIPIELTKNSQVIATGCIHNLKLVSCIGKSGLIVYSCWLCLPLRVEICCEVAAKLRPPLPSASSSLSEFMALADSLMASWMMSSFS